MAPSHWVGGVPTQIRTQLSHFPGGPGRVSELFSTYSFQNSKINWLDFDGFEGKSVQNHRIRAQIL